MKTAEWHQRSRSGDFIVKLKKETPFLRLDKLIPDGRLLFEKLFPIQVIQKILTRSSLEPPWT